MYTGVCTAALADLEAAVEQGLGDVHLPDCHYHIGLACANLDRHEEAAEAFSAV